MESKKQTSKKKERDNKMNDKVSICTFETIYE